MVRKDSQKNYKLIYFRNQYHPVVKKFREMIKDDEWFTQLRSKKNDSLFSIAISELISKYVGEKLAEQGMEPQVSEVSED